MHEKELGFLLLKIWLGIVIPYEDIKKKNRKVYFLKCQLGDGILWIRKGYQLGDDALWRRIRCQLGDDALWRRNKMSTRE